MKKAIFSGLTAAALTLSSSVHAEYKEVGRAAADARHAATSKMWQNIALAGVVAAVAVAVVVAVQHSGKNP
jgi:hypothetical protein